MNNYRGRVINVVILVFIVIASVLVVSINGDEQQKQKPNAAERAIGYLDPFNHWDKLKSWAKLTWLSYGPSNERTAEPNTDAGMKDAVTKSFETSKETAEHAAKVAGHAVHMTAEKVKNTVSGSGKEDEEYEL